jgi:hypothetical protein
MLTADVANWHVNLPAVEIDPELPAFAIPDLAFLVRFRLVFHLLRFYEVTGHCLGDEEYRARCIEKLCEEIQDSMKEWPVVSATPSVLLGWRLRTNSLRRWDKERLPG